MCHDSCLDYVQTALSEDDFEAKSVLEVGSCNINGSPRDVLRRFGASQYVGVDVQDGPGVDQVCDVSGLVSKFGEGSFDIVISTEMLEHVEDWRLAVQNLKTVTAPGGTLLLTTRSPGFAFHGYPADYWRFTIEDMETIFGDLVDLEVVADPEMPGVFVRGIKPASYRPADLSRVKILSVVRRRRTLEVTGLDRSLSRAFAEVRRMIPVRVMNAGRFVKAKVRERSRS